MLREVVFFNVPHLSVGRGGEIWESQVIEYLNNSGGFRARLITTDCCFQHEVSPGFEYKIIPLKRRFGLHLYDYESIRDDLEGADLVYYFNSFIGSQIPILTNIKNIKTGYHAKNDWNLVQRIYYGLLTYKIRNVGYHHVLTRYHYELLIKKKFRNVLVVPNFVDLSEFNISEKDPELIVAPGAVSKEKGIFTLITIAKLRKDVKIYITGNKPSVKLPDNIIYLGRLNREEFRKLLSKSVTCVLPTYGETFSLTFLECLASGNLVVARDLPVLREIAGGIKSVFFASDDNEFAGKLLLIRNIIKNRLDEFFRLSHMARERARAFDKEKVLSEFKDKITEIIDNSKNYMF